VVDVWTGAADVLGRRPWTGSTVALGYSTSKAVTSTVVHRLADRGSVEYDAPVASYWPEFAAAGKESLTVRDVLAHRSGLSTLSRVASSVDEVLDDRLMERRLAAARPDHSRGIPTYHALTYGWLISGLTRAITGMGMRELYRREIAEPLGLTGLYLGCPPIGAPVEVAELVGSHLSFVGTRWGRLAISGLTGLPIIGRAVRSLHVPEMETALDGVVPALTLSENGAVSGMFTAGALAQVYACVAGDGSVGGRRLLSPETARALRRNGKPRSDRSLLPLWHLGFHAFPTVGAPHAFGHMGINGSGGWVDPDRELAVALISNRFAAEWMPLDLSLMSALLPAIVFASRVPGVSQQPDLRTLPSAS
jgi:CubicO group peptidase (beta-lactamase class C family)